MNVASLGLCKELFGLETWHDQMTAVWFVSKKSKRTDVNLIVNQYPPRAMTWDSFVQESKYEETDAHLYELYPAYDLGYLLRKLHLQQPVLWLSGFGCWEIETRIPGVEEHEQLEATMATPEDAACKLAIELINQGILIKQ